MSTAILDKEHEEMIGSDKIQDPDTGVVYAQYGSALIDVNTSIALRQLGRGGHEYPDAILIAKHWYMPYRRHLRSSVLVAELAAAGLIVVYQDEQHAGSMACTLRS